MYKLIIAECQKVLEPFLGFSLSFITWEKWENMIVALIVALVGGFLGSLGKSLHLRLKSYFEKRKKKHAKQTNQTT